MTDSTISRDRLSNLLGISIVPTVLEAAQIEDAAGIERFYKSKLYRLLGNGETGMWHLSPATLADLYRQELESGDFDPPEEQS